VSRHPVLASLFYSAELGSSGKRFGLADVMAGPIGTTLPLRLDTLNADLFFSRVLPIPQHKHTHNSFSFSFSISIPSGQETWVALTLETSITENYTKVSQ
jgi:hypothetical protein